jgi:hypothetical protein
MSSLSEDTTLNQSAPHKSRGRPLPRRDPSARIAARRMRNAGSHTTIDLDHLDESALGACEDAAIEKLKKADFDLINFEANLAQELIAKQLEIEANTLFTLPGEAVFHPDLLGPWLEYLNQKDAAARASAIKIVERNWELLNMVPNNFAKCFKDCYIEGCKTWSELFPGIKLRYEMLAILANTEHKRIRLYNDYLAALAITDEMHKNLMEIKRTLAPFEVSQ